MIFWPFKLASTLIRWFVWSVLAFVILLAALYFYRNRVAAYAIPKLALWAFGTECRVGRVAIQPSTGRIDIYGLILLSPRGFDGPMLEARRVYLDFGIPSVLKRRWELDDAIFDIDRIVLIRGGSGELNWRAAFGPVRARRAVPLLFDARFDRLSLNVDRLELYDQSGRTVKRRLIPFKPDRLQPIRTTDDLIDHIQNAAAKNRE